MPDRPVSLEAYENMAEYYARYVDTKSWNAYYERPGTVSLLPSVDGQRVLDAGCGAGWYTEWLLDHGAQVVALDFAENMVQATRERIGSRADVRRADLNDPLDFLGDNSFDIVVSALTLHYLKDWNPVLHEFHRILKPGGVLVFSVHHPFMTFTVFERDNYFAVELLEDEWETHKGPQKVHFYRRPLSNIVNSLIDAGFCMEKLLEPMPTERFREVNPEGYERLTRRPQFLFIRARNTH